MAREILFKAKRRDNGEWVEGSLITGVFCRLGQDIPYIFCPKEADYDCFEDFSEENGIFEVQPDTICQYTGLTDKNGNKIWENDVVKKHFYTDYDAFANSEEYVGVVKFIDCAWVVETVREKNKCIRPIFEAMAYSQDVKYFEVIGNIFDNPELLGGR